ncbi:uncharacterized protein LOC102809523, partial [Saccoglossus kowalevskii]|uniref:Gamma-glutamyltranspeptidase 1-like n=1 Tax=Saccoglossus kowalevskii TaxID=10224 RepID=A0ABM0MCN7_SACKO
YKIYQVPEPAGGAILISIMNIMEGYNLTKSLHNDPLTYHRLIEAFKFAYAQKTRLGDPKYVPDVNNLTNIIITKENALKIRNKINDDKTFDPDHYDPHFPSQSHGTATVTVQDSEGNMVAVTTTVNTRFGSAVMTNSSILLNNEMSDFSWPTQHPQQIFPVSESNYIQPGKRPQSATVPTIVLNSRSPCDRRITLGGNGGTTITTGIAQILLDLLSYGNSTKDSIIKPRVHHELIPNKLLVEAKLSKTIVDELKTKGHNISIQEPVGNELMAIMMTNDKISAYADDRKKGSGAVIF